MIDAGIVETLKTLRRGVATLVQEVATLKKEAITLKKEVAASNAHIKYLEKKANVSYCTVCGERLSSTNPDWHADGKTRRDECVPSVFLFGKK